MEAGIWQPLDVTDRASIDAFIADTVERYGGIDVLVNSAGRIDPADIGRLDAIDPDVWGQAVRNLCQGHHADVPGGSAVHA